jgi:hypothetical protein
VRVFAGLFLRDSLDHPVRLRIEPEHFLQKSWNHGGPVKVDIRTWVVDADDFLSCHILSILRWVRYPVCIVVIAVIQIQAGSEIIIGKVVEIDHLIGDGISSIPAIFGGTVDSEPVVPFGVISRMQFDCLFKRSL